MMLTLPVIKRICLLIGIVLFLLWMFILARAQNSLPPFTSGSTGADGPFAPVSSQAVQVPESGVFNFTTVNIPAGMTITFLRNSKNSPVTILASGNCIIRGTVRVDGQAGNSNGAGGAGGPGGFNGGTGGYGFDSFVGVGGDGPGGGGGGGSAGGINLAGGGGGGYAGLGGDGAAQNASALTGRGGERYGSRALLPLAGGSGGGGGGAVSGKSGGGGGGGGGALLIASSGNIEFNPIGSVPNLISARGGDGAAATSGQGGGGGGGSGGAIRIIANTLSGWVSLDARAGIGGGGTVIGGAGGPGYVRLEAWNRAGLDVVALSSISFGLPGLLTTPGAPRLRIASVGERAAPASPLGSLSGPPDIVLPAGQANPVTVAIEASNVPVGTIIQVTVMPSAGPRAIVQSSPLAGTDAASTASASVAIPSGSSLLSATATIDLSLTSSAPLFIDGERVDRIEIVAAYGGEAGLTYITRTGRRIKKSG